MPSMRPPLPRVVSTSFALTLAFALGTAPVLPGVARASSVVQPGDQAEVIKQLNAEAQQLYEDGQEARAAATYGRILEIFPENKVNVEERDNTLLLMLASYVAGYRRVLSDGRPEADARALLKKALRAYDKYADEYRRAFGKDAQPSLDARDAAEAIRKLLGAEPTTIDEPPPPPDCESDPHPPDCKIEIKPLNVELPRRGVGLIVGGSVVMAAGLGMVGLIVVGAQRTKQANEDRDNAAGDQDVIDDADSQARSGRALLITGAVLGGLLLAGGATMLGIGIRRQMRYIAIAPNIGPQYVGVGLSGRF